VLGGPSVYRTPDCRRLDDMVGTEVSRSNCTHYQYLTVVSRISSHTRSDLWILLRIQLSPVLLSANTPMLRIAPLRKTSVTTDQSITAVMEPSLPVYHSDQHTRLLQVMERWRKGQRWDEIDDNLSLELS